MSEKLELFMWGYQPYFRLAVASVARDVFREMGADITPTVSIVGVRRLGATDPRTVCLEPNDGNPSLALFDRIHERVDAIVAAHPDQNMFYGDAVRNAEKPARIRADSVKTAIEAVFTGLDATTNGLSFVAHPIVLGQYDVVVVLRFVRSEYAALPQLTRTSIDLGHRPATVARGLPDAVVAALLEEVALQLQRPDPGRFSWTPDCDEMLRRAGRQVMLELACRIENVRAMGGLFDKINSVSVLPYEGEEGRGRLVLAPKVHPAVRSVVEFRHAVPLDQARWARKVLQMANATHCARSDAEDLIALATVNEATYDAATENVFIVDFKGPHGWDLRHAGATLMEVRHGVPRVPRARIDADWFKSNLKRVVSNADAEKVWRIVDVAARQRHGTIIVISGAAAAEAVRFANQGTPIAPHELDDDLVERITGIDGAVIVDPAGVCHAIGVILDGVACPEGTPSRGARFNSALRYVTAARASAPTLAVIVSEDGYIDVHPTLRPRVRRAALVELFEAAQAGLASGEERQLAESLRWMEALRFYLDQPQCDVANAVADFLRERRLAAGAIWPDVPLFTPDLGLTDEYFE